MEPEYRGFPHGVPEAASFHNPGLARHRTAASEDGGQQDSLVNQEHSIQLVENLRRIYEDEECFLADIILCSKDMGEVKAHKVILAAQSDYFKVSLVFDYRHSIDCWCAVQGMFRNEKKEKIEMNIGTETLKTVVKTLYTGKTDINIENVQDLLEASNYLQIRDLNTKCVEFMVRYVTERLTAADFTRFGTWISPTVLAS